MSRSRYLTFAWAAVSLVIVADLVAELVAEDWWRSGGFALALVCVLGIRDELTMVPQ